ncbi:uncharacterized protein DSM5745_05781 [Aspergillus mulundensis]|uniref:Carrier domain-containing protein n=1 Tax=Aspergillus mulundensis TaxID=1810919 RepID=A0A3D8RXZ0_9EURO|nr:hypothetical protein DSM5745_05781 [Aspergillus mulundensis]RDW78929.1 hypothetical protein DSM5745_05781 [Aspergillus mulundensis]
MNCTHVDIDSEGDLAMAYPDRLFQASWAVTLSVYTSSENVEFHYLSIYEGKGMLRAHAAVSPEMLAIETIWQTVLVGMGEGEVDKAPGSAMSCVRRLRVPSSASGSEDSWSVVSTQSGSVADEESRVSSPSVPHMDILDCISKYASSEPAVLAVESWDGRLSYAALEALSCTLAERLLEMRLSLGPGKSVYVPLLFEKSLWTVVAMVAVMRTGCAFVLLDPSQPFQRLQSICEEVNPSVVVCSAGCSETAALLAPAFLPLDDSLYSPLPPASLHPLSPISKRIKETDSPLYAVFTSGTTGKPKGIVINRRAFLSCARAYVRKTRLNQQTRCFQFASYAFDVSISDTLNALLVGACICIPSNEERLSKVAEGIRRLKPTWADLTPSLLRHMSPEDMHTIQTVVVSGEAMTRDVVEMWQSHVRLINVYGPAECSVSSTLCMAVSAENASDIGTAFVGSTWVVDPAHHEKLRPVGAIGELLIEGPHLGRGYLNHPAKTHAAFISAPSWLQGHFGQEFSGDQRLYCTGDLVQYQPDGSLRYVGRKDTQVKLRGQRVELGEVEHHVRAAFSHGPTVIAEVVAFDHGPSALVAFAAKPSALSDKSTSSLIQPPDAQLVEQVHAARQMLDASVPDYMIPSLFLAVSQIPLTPSGKIDRRRLRKEASDLSRDQVREYAANTKHDAKRTAQTHSELKLIAVVARVLNIEPDSVCLHDDFFALGGDSITAMRVVAQYRQEGLVLETGDVLRHRTIAKLAAVSVPDSCPNSIPIPIEDPEDVAFDLSPIQAMLFEDSPDDANYFNQSFFVAMSRDIDLHNLSLAAHAVVDRHSMLRARFSRSENGVWTQRITGDRRESFRCKEHLLGHKGQVTDIMNQSQAMFDLESGPIFSLDLIRIDGEPYPFLFVNTHHAVIDLVSYRILLEDLEDFLDTGELSAQSSPMPFQWWCRLQAEYAETTLHPDAALSMSMTLDAGVIDKYWALEGVANNYGNAQTTPLLIDEATTGLILTTANQTFRTQPVELLHAAVLHSFLTVFSDRPPPTIFSEGHGREPWHSSIDPSRTVGWFTTIWPAPVDFNGFRANDISDLVRRVKDARRSVPGKGHPYFASRYLNSHGREMLGKQKMEIVFNFHGQFQQFERGDSLFQHVAWEYKRSQDYGPETLLPGLFEITCAVVHSRLQFEFIYGKALAHQPEIMQWIQQCAESLGKIAELLSSSACAVTLTDLPQLSLSYSDLDQLEQKLFDSGISFSDLEDIYPALPMQEGIMLSQARNATPGLYRTGSVLEFKLNSDYSDPHLGLGIEGLHRAWEQVVGRHSALRTVLLPSDSTGHAYNSFILKPGSTLLSSSLSIIRYQPYGDKEAERLSVVTMLREQREGAHPQQHLPWQIKFFAPSGPSPSSVFCDIEFNHAIMDGWSSSVLIREWVEAYNGQLPVGDASKYGDYVSHIQGKDMTTSLEYWQEYLAQAECCHFPSLVDHGEPTKNELYNVDVVLSEPNNLSDFLKRHSATVTSVFHVAWGLLLRSYTGNNDVCFGHLTSGRDVPIPGVEAAVGLFANLLPYRIVFSNGDTPYSLLRNCQDALAQGLSHQHVSLTKVMANLGLRGQALFNTVLSVQGSIPRESPETRVGGLVVEEVEEVDPTEYDIALNVHFTGAEVRAYLSCWTSKISPWQANNVADTLAHIVSQIVTLPEEVITNISLLGSEQRRALEAQNLRTPMAIDECVHELFRRQALSAPDASAVCAWDGSLSYRELDEASSRIAEVLRSTGIGVGDWVPLFLERSRWVPIAILGVLKSGAAFVMMESSFPLARLCQIADDTDASVILTVQNMMDRARTVRQKAIALDVMESGPLGCTVPDSASARSPAPTSRDALYAVFSSGSTGKPKGIVIEHCSYASSCFAHAPAARYNSRSRVFHFASYAFDACMAEILTTLIVGGCICIPSEKDRWNDMAGAVARLQANHVILTPSTLRSLDPRQFPSLKTVLVGGEALSLKELQQWCDAGPSLIQMYGPSEAAVYSSGTEPLRSTSDVREIGRVLGSRAWVVDPRNPHVLAPIGAVGELVLEGPSVARGYLNNPEQTGAAFIDPPAWRDNFSCHRSGRLYRTGDLVQYTKGGTIRITGRIGTQVKLRGQRIELGEIECVLNELFPECSDIVVEMVTPDAGSARPAALVAFLSGHVQNSSCFPEFDGLLQPLSGKLQTQLDDARYQLSERLPYYMIPEFFLAVEQLPLSAGGKADRKRLRSEAATLIEGGALESASPPARDTVDVTPAEREMRALVAEVLGRPPATLGVEENFFRIGGDSLVAMKLVQLARSRNINLTVRDIFQSPQISALASSVQIPEKEENKPQPAASTTPDVAPFSLLSPEYRVRIIREVAEKVDVDREGIEDIYPCTPLQEGMLSLSLRSPSAYVAQNTYALPVGCDLARVKKAWEQLIQANSILRTRIVQTSSSQGALQVVLHSSQLDWCEGDDLESYLKADQQRPMGMMDSLLRLAMVHDNGCSYVVVTIHHALYDGWSEGLLLEQLEAAYTGQSLVVRRFAPFVQYIRDTNHLAEEFWQGKLAGLAVTSTAFPPAPSSNCQPIPTASATRSMKLTAGHMSSPFTLSSHLRLAWALTSSHFTASATVRFGVIVSGRSAPMAGIENITGPTIATLPVRVFIDPSQTIDEMLSNIQEASTRTAPFEQFGLQNIRALGEAASMECQFQSLLLVQPSNDDGKKNPLLRPVNIEGASARFDTYPLTLQCSILDSSVDVEAIFDGQIISPNMMRSVLEHFTHVFEQIATDTSRSVAEISPVSTESAARLTKWYCESRECQPVEDTVVVHDLITRQCQSQPAAPAVNAWDGDFSYEQVDRLSSAFAVRLIHVGVGLESIVPVCFEKSKWLAVIMLGILKAGAAFVLLDPSSQPLERLQYMVEAVGAKFAINSETFSSLVAQFPGVQSILLSEETASIATDGLESMPAVTGQNALYTIFTSGTEGKPKAAVIEHEGYIAGSLSRQQVTGLHSGSRVLQFSSCAFDAFVTDILDTFIAGGCVCIPSESDRNAHLGQFARDMRITYADLVPSVARLLSPHDVPTLETFALSGEAMAADDIAQWADKVKLCNLYGPAECSAVATGRVVSRADPNPSNIGRGCGGFCWVVDPADHTRLLPIGATGELVIEGSIVGRGYLGNVQGPAASNFLREQPPWRQIFPHAKGNARMYKTGDLAHYNADGTLTFIGRKDQQVKLHGQRLELGDVEHQLRRAFDSALDVVADVVDSSSKKRLVAFVLMEDSDETASDVYIPSSAEFRVLIRTAEKILRSALPGFMVPTAFFPICALPRAPSGKVGRRRLKQAAADFILRDGLEPYTAARERRAPETEAERKLLAIWAQTLGLEASSVGVEDGFLQLGGDSITAMRAAALAMAEGLQVSIPKLFQNESLRNLAAETSSKDACSLNWEQEAAFQLPDDVQLPLLSYSSLPGAADAPRDVLLTGATGCLGSELVQQLIQYPEVDTVHCIAVRTPSRLPVHEKIAVYPGDLSLPRLGLTEEQEAMLLERCRVIIHCGARVSFVQDYATMRAFNVESTKHLARLALKAAIPFHFISTIGVLHPKGENSALEEVAVTNPPKDGAADGYTATKWVSEAFLENVNAQTNLPIFIHRPSNITSGSAPETDIINNLLDYSRRMKMVPRLNGWKGYFDLVRCELAASNITESVLHSIQCAITDSACERQPRVEHIHESGETVFAVGALKTYLEAEGGQFEEVSIATWIEHAVERGMAKLVGDFLRQIDEDGEKIEMPPIRSRRQPLCVGRFQGENV